MYSTYSYFLCVSSMRQVNLIIYFFLIFTSNIISNDGTISFLLDSIQSRVWGGVWRQHTYVGTTSEFLTNEKSGIGFLSLVTVEVSRLIEPTYTVRLASDSGNSMLNEPLRERHIKHSTSSFSSLPFLTPILLWTGHTSRLGSSCLEESFEDDDVEVDVEECSDGEASVRQKSKLLRQSPAISDCGSEVADIDRESPDVIPEKGLPKAKVLCNCDELLSTECHLETKDLWDKFHDLGTEMIITKTGR